MDGINSFARVFQTHLTMPPTEGQAWKYFKKYFNCVVKEKNGNRLSSCRVCETTFSGSHVRHVAHFDPTDPSIGTCEKAPEGVLNHVSSILQDRLSRQVSKKRLHDLAQLASADRTVRTLEATKDRQHLQFFLPR